MVLAASSVLEMIKVIVHVQPIGDYGHRAIAGSTKVGKQESRRRCVSMRAPCSI